jgi:hypothetical protein
MKRKVVGTLERRKGMGRITPDNRSRPSYDVDDDLGEFARSLDEGERYVIFKEEKLSGKITPIVSSFTKRPFDNLDEALENAKIYILTVSERLEELDKTRKYTVLRKESDARFEGTSYLLVGNPLEAQDTTVTKDSYTVHVYVKKTSYYQKGDSAEYFDIVALMSTDGTNFELLDELSISVKGKNNAIARVEKIFKAQTANFRAAGMQKVAAFKFVETGLAANSNNDKLIKALMKDDKPLVIVGVVGVKTKGNFPKIRELKNG